MHVYGCERTQEYFKDICRYANTFDIDWDEGRMRSNIIIYNRQTKTSLEYMHVHTYELRLKYIYITLLDKHMHLIVQYVNCMQKGGGGEWVMPSASSLRTVRKIHLLNLVIN